MSLFLTLSTIGYLLCECSYHSSAQFHSLHDHFSITNIGDPLYSQFVNPSLYPELRLVGARRSTNGAIHQTGAELRTEEHMFSQWRMRSDRFRDVPSHLSSQAKVIVFSLSLI